MSKPETAAVLSFFIPGVGQIYNGAFLRGIFWLIITPVDRDGRLVRLDLPPDRGVHGVLVRDQARDGSLKEEQPPGRKRVRVQEPAPSSRLCPESARPALSSDVERPQEPRGPSPSRAGNGT